MCVCVSVCVSVCVWCMCEPTRSSPTLPHPAGRIIKAPNGGAGGQCSRGRISSGLINEAGELMRRKLSGGSRAAEAV